MLLRLAWRNLGRGWRRSAIVVTSITVGLAASVFVIAWMNGMFFQMTDNAIHTSLADVAVHAPGYWEDPQVERSIANRGAAVIREAEALGGEPAPRLRGDGLIQSSRQSVRAIVTGIDPEREPRISIVPDSLTRGAFLPARKGSARSLPAIYIGERMAERLHVDLGQKVVLHVAGSQGGGAFRVRGMYRTSASEFDRAVVFVRLEDAQVLDAVGDVATEVAVALADPEHGETFARDLAARLGPAAAGPLEVRGWKEREPRLAALVTVASSTAWIFYAVLFVAMAFGIANALLMAVHERMREFGVLRSLGLRPRRLVSLVLVESLLLTGVGTFLGLGIGIAISEWLGVVGMDLSMFSDALETYAIGTTIYPRTAGADSAAAVVLATVTALLAALWPALKAARIRPAEALRRI